MLRIGELARIAGVTPRLLRHYEAIGILAPTVVNARSGYRYYEPDQLVALQQILAYRDAGVPLATIARLAHAPDLLVERHRQTLMAQRDVLERQLAALEAYPSRPFRIKRTSPMWAASVRQSVESYEAAEEALRQLRASLAVDEQTPSAGIWYDCRPEDGRIDCEMQVVFNRPGRDLRAVPSQLVVSYAHTGPDTELPSIYREMHQWSRTARYRHCGPLREVYWNGITEVQFPVC